PAHWSAPAQPFDAFDLKGLAERIAAELGLQLQIAAGAGVPADGGAGTDSADAAPAAAVTLSGVSALLAAPRFDFMDAAGRTVGTAGRVRPAAVDSPAWAGDIWGIEIELIETMPGRRSFLLRPLPTFPAIERDLALLVPATLPAADVSATIRQKAGALLEDVAPFDLFIGKGIPEGVRSIAYRLRFRSAERTLTDDETDQAIARVLRALEEAHGVTRRA
ncbi:MAG: hypothetical protein ACREKM_07435, partial [Longimicrobiales bacterium]